MVVEDDNAVRRSLQLLLRSRGYDVRAYSGAAPALADPLARSARCLIADLVLDHQGADGIALLEQLRNEGWQGPAILISGYLTAEREARARRAGFDKILSKPVAESIVVSELGRVLNPDHDVSTH